MKNLVIQRRELLHSHDRQRDLKQFDHQRRHAWLCKQVTGRGHGQHDGGETPGGEFALVEQAEDEFGERDGDIDAEPVIEMELIDDIGGLMEEMVDGQDSELGVIGLCEIMIEDLTQAGLVDGLGTDQD